VLASIFADFNLPNAPSWFYFSLVLAVALFFKFTRLLSVRNLDVVGVFLLVPGFLLHHEARTVAPEAARKLLWYGYLALIGGSGILLVRCLIDLALVRRPALNPNLNISGMAWLMLALFACLTVVALRGPGVLDEKVGRESVALDKLQERTTSIAQPLADEANRARVRFYVERTLALACHLGVVVGLVLIGGRHFQDVTTGMAMGTFYLLLPYTAFHIGQLHHVWPALWLVWALFCYRKPTLSGVFLGLAAGSVFFPAFTLPAWLSFYRGRGVGRFLVCFALAAGLSLALTGAVLFVDGQLAYNLHLTLTMADWQAWKMPETDSIWNGSHWAFRLPVFVVYLTFVVLTAYWPQPKSLAHLLALNTALLIGIQFWYADRGGVYVLWYLPTLLLMLFRPNLSERTAPAINPETDWLTRRGQAARQWYGQRITPMLAGRHPGRVNG
jgi:hypothetical protein